MKKKATLLLTLGLLLTTMGWFVCRQFHLSDSVLGLMTGAGLAIEIIALGMMQRGRRSCSLAK